MPAWLMTAIRFAIMSAWGLLASTAARRDIDLPADPPPWVEDLLLAVSVGVVAAVIRWLETRSWGPARTLARLVMLGIRSHPTGYSQYSHYQEIDSSPTIDDPFNSGMDG